MTAFDPASAGIVADHVADLRMRGQSERSIGGRVGALDLLCRFAGKPLLQVTAADLRGWQRAMMGGSGRAPLGVRTRRSYSVHARQFYRWALAEGLITEDPSTVLILPKPPKGRPRPIGEDDLTLALAAAGPRVRVWLMLAAGSGLRAMEIAGLCREDVVERAESPHLVIRGKGQKTRSVPLSPAVLAALRAYGMPMSGPLFRRRDGDPVNAHYVSKVANEFLHKAGTPESLHQLRHRFATRLHRATRDIRLVQEMLGHESLATTANYVDFDRDEAATAIGALMAGVS